MKGLYHYTATMHLPQILDDGYLKLTRGILEDCAVWFTTSKDAQGNGLEGSVLNKYEIKFIMKDIPAIKWKDYRKKTIRGEDKALKEKWANSLEVNQKPNTWWLSQEVVTLDKVQAIENTLTGEVIHLPSTTEEILAKLTSF